LKGGKLNKFDLRICKDEDIFSILCSVNDMRADPKGYIGAALKSTCNDFGIEIPNQ
jgi:hypothetical protein